MSTEKTPMTGEGFKQAFEEVRDRAGIVEADPKRRLTPHSLRAAAEMMFRRAGLNDKEIDIMKNGPKSHYDVVEEFLEIIQPKLDAIFLKKPREEVENEYEDMMVSFGTREEIATLLSSILTDLAEEVA